MTVQLAPGSTLDRSVLVHFRITYVPYSMYYPRGGRYTTCVTGQARFLGYAPQLRLVRNVITGTYVWQLQAAIINRAKQGCDPCTTNATRSVALCGSPCQNRTDTLSLGRIYSIHYTKGECIWCDRRESNPHFLLGRQIC